MRNLVAARLYRLHVRCMSVTFAAALPIWPAHSDCWAIRLHGAFTMAWSNFRIWVKQPACSTDGCGHSIVEMQDYGMLRD
jgi:hypothetical protein